MKYTLLLMGIIGLYGFISGLRTVLRDRKRSLVPGTAVIVGMEQQKDREGFVSFTPVYEYHYAGQSYRGKHRISSSRYGKGMHIETATKYTEGTQVPILIDENDPSWAVINDRSKNMGIPVLVMFLILGIGCLIASIVFF